MRTIIPAITAISIVASAPAWAQESKPEDVYAKVLPSTMTLTVDKGDGKIAIGTAFMCVKEGMAVTAWHVVRDAKQVVAKFSTGEEFEVSGLVDKDEARDVALIRVKVFGRPTLTTMTADPQVGSKAFVIGSPKGLDFSFSDGIVSQIQTMDGVKQVQFTCAASPGNSGGPLINGKGEVIGVVSWQLRDSQNLNFAVPIAYVLGLDNTLPTQPWGSVKSTTPLVAKNDGTTVSTEEFDKALADAMVLQQTAAVLGQWVDIKVLDRRFGYESGMPPEGYALKADAEARATKLASIDAPDKSREKWRNITVELLKEYAQRLDLVSKAIKTAQINRGFTPQANESLREANALLLREISDKLSKEDVEKLKSSKIFMDTLPLDSQILYGLREDDEGYTLGVQVFPRSPTTLAIFFKDSLAGQMGLKEGDKIIGADNHDLATLHDFKMYVKIHTGQKVKVTVKRSGKIQDVELKIPSLLPKRE